MEGKEWIFENGTFKEEDLMDLRQKLGNTRYSKDREELILKSFERFFSEI